MRLGTASWSAALCSGADIKVLCAGRDHAEAFGKWGTIRVDQPLLLIVEDEPLVSMIAEEALQAGGYGVAIVTSAAEAVEVLDTRSAEFAGD